jgi:hypothetical protein
MKKFNSVLILSCIALSIALLNIEFVGKAVNSKISVRNLSLIANAAAEDPEPNCPMEYCSTEQMCNMGNCTKRTGRLTVNCCAATCPEYWQKEGAVKKIAQCPK